MVKIHKKTFRDVKVRCNGLTVFLTVFQPCKESKARYDYYNINNSKTSHFLYSFLSLVCLLLIHNILLNAN